MRWYDRNGNKVSEEQARQEDFDPCYYVEVEVDVEDDHGRDDYIEYNKNRSQVKATRTISAPPTA